MINKEKSIDMSKFCKTDFPLRGGTLLPLLIQLRGHECECCHNKEWLGYPINLQVHHIDGDKCNNELNNLQLLCLNCHSYTDNFGSKNNKHIKISISDEELIEALKNHSSARKALLSLGLSDAGGNYKRVKRLIKENNLESLIGQNKKINRCIDCGEIIELKSIRCHSCENIRRNKENNLGHSQISREMLKEKIRNQSFVSIGKEFNVSDNAIRKWCKAKNLPTKKAEIKKYTDEEWIQI